MWSSLLATIVGGLLAAGGGAAASILAGRREDRARSYDSRREIYFEFLEEWNRYHVELHEIKKAQKDGYWPDDTDPNMDDEYLHPLWSSFRRIEILGGKKVIKSALSATEELDDWCFGDERALNQKVIEDYLQAVRRDLGIA